MRSRQFLRAIETGILSLSGLIDVVSNIIGVCPLIVFHLKETGKKDSGDSFDVCLFLVALNFVYLPLLVFVFLFRRKGWMDTSSPISWAEWSSACSFWSLNYVIICISCHDCVVFPNFTYKFGMEILGVNMQHSYWDPNLRMVRDF